VVPPIVDKSGRSKPGPKPTATKGIVLSLIAGILMGSFFPLIQIARKDDVEVGPYVLALCFAAGVFLSTPLYNLYFMGLPVQGPPVKLRRYIEGTVRQHLLGLAGGVIWCVGGVANFVAASAPESAQVGPAVSYALGQGATLVSTLWGLLVWKEFATAPPRALTLIRGAVLLYLVGLALISVAPVFARA
jgi:glucose uptake protein